MICRNCNANIPNGSSVCPNCGQRLSTGGGFKSAGGLGGAPSNNSYERRSPEVKINMGRNSGPDIRNNEPRYDDRRYDDRRYDDRRYDDRRYDDRRAPATGNPSPSFFQANVKFLPSFIVGLIAGIFGLFGGLCLSVCASFVGDDGAVLALVCGGSLIGIVGACLCFSKAQIGSIIQAVAATLMIIGITVIGSDFMTLIAIGLFVVSSIMGIIVSIMKIKSNK